MTEGHAALLRGDTRLTARNDSTSSSPPLASGGGDALALEVSKVHKAYGGGVQALQDINLTVTGGEFLTLVGPSGSGKTTLLMIVAGFERPTSGRVAAAGADVTGLPPEKRNFGVVFQSYALFPHMSVAANVGYPLSVRRVARGERRARVEEMLEVVGLEGLGRRRPSELSGGQQQRVALARALVYRPGVLLLDEPLGALDRALRERMQDELTRLHQQLGTTFIYVTHDQDEALSMSDRVAVMRDGRVEQIGTPLDIYSRPDTRFVATFLGAANLVAGTVVRAAGGRRTVKLGSQQVELQADHAPTEPGAEVAVVLRPERGALRTSDAPADSDEIAFPARLQRERYVGGRWRCEAATVAGELRIETPARPALDPAGSLLAVWAKADAWVVANPSSSADQSPVPPDDEGEGDV